MAAGCSRLHRAARGPTRSRWSLRPPWWRSPRLSPWRRSATRGRRRYAGAFLLYAALARVDLWGVFRRLAVTTGPARWYGWAHTVAAIVCGFGLRFRSIEDLKNALRADLGVLLGTAQAPTVLVLRQKIKALAESVVPVALARALFRRYVALEPVWEGVYYVDGHFCPYYGQHPTPQGWNPHRWLAVPVTRMSTSTMRAGACCFSSRRRSHTPSKPCSEPYRVCRRAFSLRGWSHVTTESVFPRSTRASGAAGPRARG